MNKLKRIVALCGVIILVAVVALTLFFAITDNPNKMLMFKGCFGVMIFLPCAIWILSWWHKIAKSIMEIQKKKIEEGYKGQDK